MWSSHPQFQGIVKEEWARQIEGCRTFQVVSKLKALKQKLRGLHTTDFRNIMQEVDKDRAELQRVQMMLQQRPMDDDLQMLEKEVCMRFKRSSYLAETMLIQRSKATWIKLGDDNTKYFHSILKQKKLVQAITQLQDENHQIQHEPGEIAAIFGRFYQKLLGETGGQRKRAYEGFLKNGYTLSVTQQLELLQNYTRKDVKEAMFNINKIKSPGPDGYGSGFFRDTWGITGEDISEAVLEFFRNGILLKELNATVITLIPKITNPENASQFRPISCCNVVYKCISKMLCKRLKGVLPSLVKCIMF